MPTLKSLAYAWSAGSTRPMLFLTLISAIIFIVQSVAADGEAAPLAAPRPSSGLWYLAAADGAILAVFAADYALSCVAAPVAWQYVERALLILVLLLPLWAALVLHPPRLPSLPPHYSSLTSPLSQVRAWGPGHGGPCVVAACAGVRGPVALAGWVVVRLHAGPQVHQGAARVAAAAGARGVVVAVGRGHE